MFEVCPSTVFNLAILRIFSCSDSLLVNKTVGKEYYSLKCKTPLEFVVLIILAKLELLGL